MNERTAIGGGGGGVRSGAAAAARSRTRIAGVGSHGRVDDKSPGRPSDRGDAASGMRAESRPADQRAREPGLPRSPASPGPERFRWPSWPVLAAEQGALRVQGHRTCSAPTLSLTTTTPSVALRNPLRAALRTDCATRSSESVPTPLKAARQRSCGTSSVSKSSDSPASPVSTSPCPGTKFRATDQQSRLAVHRLPIPTTHRHVRPPWLIPSRGSRLKFVENRPIS